MEYKLIDARYYTSFCLKYTFYSSLDIPNFAL